MKENKRMSEEHILTPTASSAPVLPKVSAETSRYDIRRRFFLFCFCFCFFFFFCFCFLLPSLATLTKSLEEFAAKGAWRNVFKLTESIKYSDKEEKDAFYYVVFQYRLLALLKLKMYKNAQEQLAGLDFGVAAIPFGVRFLGAITPSLMNNHQLSLDLLYGVLEWLEGADQEQRGGSKERRRTQLAQVAVLSRQKDFLTAIDLVNQMLEENKEDGELLSVLTHLYLELGDLLKAAEICELAQVQLTREGSSEREKMQSLMNYGLLYFSQSDYKGAIGCFDQVLETENIFTVSATNNKAVCLLFTQRLDAAVALLEQPLTAQPKKYLEETFVCNLLTLLDLHSDKPTEKKNGVAKLIAAHGDDSFDTSLVSH
jgi:tetratricopeptide (TPR) repeat protein